MGKFMYLYNHYFGSGFAKWYSPSLLELDKNSKLAKKYKFQRIFCLTLQGAIYSATTLKCSQLVKASSWVTLYRIAALFPLLIPYKGITPNVQKAYVTMMLTHCLTLSWFGSLYGPASLLTCFVTQVVWQKLSQNTLQTFFHRKDQAGFSLFFHAAKDGNPNTVRKLFDGMYLLSEEERRMILQEEIKLAISHGCLNLLKQLLNTESNLEHYLGMAAIANQWEIVDFLLEKQAKFPKKEIPTAWVVQAIKEGSLLRLKAFMESGASIGEKELNQILIKAIQNGDQEMLEKLLERGVEDYFHLGNGIEGGMIHYAVIYGQQKLVDFLIKRCPNFLNKEDSKGNTPLHWAAREGNLKMVTRLIDLDADFEVMNMEGKTARTLAQINGHLSCVDFLLSFEYLLVKDPKDPKAKDLLEQAVLTKNVPLAKKLIDFGVDIKDGYGTDPNKKVHLLFIAMEFGNKEIVRYILDKDPEVVHQMHSPLAFAIDKKLEELIGLLLERKADPFKLIENDHVYPCMYGGTPVILACFKKKLSLLLTNGVDINGKDKHGNTAAHRLVSRFNDIEAFRELLKHHPDLSIKDSAGKTPIKLAISGGIHRLEYLSLLVEAGATIDQNIPLERQLYRCIKNGNSPLHLFVIFSNGKTINETIWKWILKRKEEFSKKNNNGETPLHIAAKTERLYPILNFFLTHDPSLPIDFAAADNDGNTLLHILAKKVIWDGISQSNDLLQNVQKKVNSDDLLKKNKDGNTPLHLAAIAGNKMAVHFLVSVKPNKAINQIRNNENKTPLMCAIEHGHFHLINDLLFISKVLVLLSKHHDQELFLKLFLKDSYPSGAIFKDPCGGETWIPLLIPLFDELKTEILEAPFLFHDVHFARRIFPMLNEELFQANIKFLEEKYSKEMVAWLIQEWEAYEKRIQIHASHLNFVLGPNAIPEAPISFEKSEEKIFAMFAPLKVQNSEVAKAKLTHAFNLIKNRKFATSYSGNPGTDTHNFFYEVLQSVTCHVVHLLSKADQSEQVRFLNEILQMGCQEGIVEIMFTYYEILKKDAEMHSFTYLEKKIAFILFQMRERIVSQMIATQKGEYGEESHPTHDMNVAFWIRKALQDRGVSQPIGEDAYVKPWITPELMENRFDKYYIPGAIVDEVLAAINSNRLKSGEVMHWLRDQFATEVEGLEKKTELIVEKYYLEDDTGPVPVYKITREGVIKMLVKMAVLNQS